MSLEQPTAAAIVGGEVPDLLFPSTRGDNVALKDRALGDYVLFVYPRTGRPDQPDSAEWGTIPGAKGCTAEACDFRDLERDFAAVGYSVLGLSSQSSGYQREAADRLHLPYPLLSDTSLRLAGALGLETFVFDQATLYRRVTLLVEGGMIAAVVEPGDDPAGHPDEALAVARERAAA